jgi:hypothetical protein
MGSFGDYFRKKEKKLSKEELARRAAKSATSSSWAVPQPQVIKKGKRQ